MQMELQGARTFQRMAIEADARGHLSTGPGRTKWRADVQEHGVRKAIRIRDSQYGFDPIRIRYSED
jgi:enoyl-CoA hydratase